jgi:threonine/homoserine/homoserine lactone efflux protein
MQTLLLLLLAIFAGVALMVVLGERFGRPMDAAGMQRLSRWLVPLVGLMLVLSAVRYFLDH